MKNTKVLELINAGQIEELKKLLEEEIYKESLNTSNKKRYSAMKKYFKYSKDPREAFQMPYEVEFEGEAYTSLSNSCSIALTKEKAEGMEYLTDKSLQFNTAPCISMKGIKQFIDINAIIAKAKAMGYKLKKVNIAVPTYVLFYDNAYYSIGLLDVTYSVINNETIPETYHIEQSDVAPLVIKNDIGICMVLSLRIKNTDEKPCIINADEFIVK